MSFEPILCAGELFGHEAGAFDLRAEIARGAFRQDLYFRINGITLDLPPLRERRAEIAPLAELFAARAASEADHPRPPVFSPSALAALSDYHWPGNVRELRNAIERAVILAGDDPIEPEHLPTEILAAKDGEAHGSPSALSSEMQALERKRIEEALAQCDWNQTRAADVLGMPRRTLVRRIREYGLGKRRS